MDDLQEERMKQIPPKISDTLQSLAEEEPLNTSDLFKKFIEDVRKSAVGQEESAVLRTTLKRKRITEIPKFSRQYELVDKDMRRGDSTNPELCQHAAGDMPKIQGGRPSPIAKLPMLGDRLFSALQSSHQWQWERTVGGTGTSDCLNILVPKNRDQDVSITLLVGHESGLRLIHELEAIRV
ncbi:hypothetical protein N7444_010399 [Penicillium canescens]|nr:hypothetical protein N7444_010399 [Penicillium canescens]